MTTTTKTAPTARTAEATTQEHQTGRPHYIIDAGPVSIITGCDCDRGVLFRISGAAYPCPYCEEGERMAAAERDSMYYDFQDTEPQRCGIEWPAADDPLWLAGEDDGDQDDALARWEETADIEAELWREFCADRAAQYPL